MNFNNFTIKSQEAVQQAQELALAGNHQQIETAHILKGMLEDEDSVVLYLLKKLNVNINQLNSRLDEVLNKYPKVEGNGGQYLSQAANNALSSVQKYLKEYGDEFVSVEHLLLGILSGKDDTAKLLKELGINEKELKLAIASLRKGSKVTDQGAEQRYQALEKYARNLNDAASKGKLDPVIGRDEEIRRVLHILSRRTKNNPILVGEPGVGKTAIAEGIAHRIVNGDVPENLKNKTIFALDVVALMAGAKFRRI